MRDEETETYWQQISGRAVSGPLAGSELTLIPSDELTLALWKAEEPGGLVLADVPRYASEYAARDWDVEMQRMPVVGRIPASNIRPRDLMIGLHVDGAARAFPFDAVLKQKLVQDHVGKAPVVLVVGPDGESVRAFRDQIPGTDGTPDLYRLSADVAHLPLSAAADAPLMMDSTTGSRWDFRGCAVEGRAKGRCLERIEAIKDYWFDWRNYNPDTTVYGVIADRGAAHGTR